MHSNGFGHLARLNGREGGSKRASGRQLMQVCSTCGCMGASPTGQQRGVGARGSGLLASGWEPPRPDLACCCLLVTPPSLPSLAHSTRQLWDDLCEVLRVREVSTEDVSNKARPVFLVPLHGIGLLACEVV